MLRQLPITIGFLVLCGSSSYAGGLLDDVLRDVQRQVQGAAKDVGKNVETLRPIAPLPSPTVGKGIDALPERAETTQSVPIEAFPWVVGFVGDPGSGGAAFCGGVIIAKDWVLTSAHCLDPLRIRSDVAIVANTSDIRKQSRTPVAQIKIHPGWHSGSFENDVALIRVFAKFEPSKTLPIEGPPIEAQIGAIGQVVGWGITRLGTAPSETLQLIPTRVLSRGSCIGPSTYPGLGRDKFCAQSLLMNAEVCEGFGGSGLVLVDPNGRRYLAGIVSAGEGCPPETHKPVAYTDVASQSDWILSVIRGSGGP